MKLVINSRLTVDHTAWCWGLLLHAKSGVCGLWRGVSPAEWVLECGEMDTCSLCRVSNVQVSQLDMETSGQAVSFVFRCWCWWCCLKPGSTLCVLEEQMCCLTVRMLVTCCPVCGILLIRSFYSGACQTITSCEWCMWMFWFRFMVEGGKDWVSSCERKAETQRRGRVFVKGKMTSLRMYCHGQAWAVASELGFEVCKTESFWTIWKQLKH